MNPQTEYEIDAAFAEFGLEDEERIDVARLMEAIDAIPPCPLLLSGDEHHVHRSDAPQIAAEYARLASDAR